MLLLVDRHNGIPAYRQIMDQIRFQIASGVLREGDELPSTRALSAELELNPMTVSKAYGYLEKEGVLERRPGLPLIVRGLTGDDGEVPKLEQLRLALVPVVTVARQLGLGRERTLEVLGEMLGEDEQSGGTR